MFRLEEHHTATQITPLDVGAAQERPQRVGSWIRATAADVLVAVVVGLFSLSASEAGSLLFLWLTSAVLP